MRSTSAASTPTMITLRRCSAGNPAASAPTTIALSPASTMSIASISKKAAIAEGVIMLAMSMPSRLAESEHAPQAQDVIAADPTFVDHADGDVEDDAEPDVVDPVIPLDQARDVIGGEPHEQHREGQADEQQRGILARDRGHQQHVVEAHAEVGRGDLDRGPQECLGWRRP